jgi:hypothetical protein
MLKTVVTTLLFAVALAACGSAPAPTAPSAALQNDSDLYAIGQIEVSFHRASSTKDVNLMMSLWADNATLTLVGKTYTGKDEIRGFFATVAGPFKPENNWISETPAYKTRVTANGNKGTLYFECHYVDIDTNSVVSVIGADQNVAKIDGRWLITTLSSSSLPELTP